MSIISRTIPLLAVTATLGLTAAPAVAGTGHHDGTSTYGDQHAKGHGHDYGKHRVVCGLDKAWLKAIARGDLAEIATGNLAQQKGTSQGVKDLGAMLVADHTKHLAMVRDLAGRLGLTLPDAPSPTQQWEAAVLGTFSGAAFDQQWISLQIAAHQENIEKTQDEIADGCNRYVRALAAMTLPTLQAHLAAAQKLAGGGTTTGTGTSAGGGTTSGGNDTSKCSDDSGSRHDGCCDDDSGDDQDGGSHS